MSAIGRFVDRSKKSGEGPAGVLLDGICYGIGLVSTGLKMNDYFLRKNLQGRRMGWTKYASGRLAEKMRRLNPQEMIDLFSNKDRFDEKFQKYLGREWICPKDVSAGELCAFLQRHPVSFAKPRAGRGGKSAGLVHLPETEAEMRALHAELAQQDLIVEEKIAQHPAVSGFFPKAVNTVRMTTFYTENGPVLLSPTMRIGRGENVADNFEAGGFSVTLDVETGRIMTGAVDKNYIWYENHPESGKKFEGFIVPNWDKVRAMCLAAAAEVPKAAYVGWDVAITSEGCVLVEGNTRPSLAWQCHDKRGWRKEFSAAYRSARRYQKKAR